MLGVPRLEIELLANTLVADGVIGKVTLVEGSQIKKRLFQVRQPQPAHLLP